MARVQEVIPDKKGFVRRAKVKTATTVLIRPVNKQVMPSTGERKCEWRQFQIMCWNVKGSIICVFKVLFMETIKVMVKSAR